MIISLTNKCGLNLYNIVIDFILQISRINIFTSEVTINLQISSLKKITYMNNFY
jgi:hypothetical protein